MRLETTPKPEKNTGHGVPRWPPVALKYLLLTITNALSSYLEIRERDIHEKKQLQIWYELQSICKRGLPHLFEGYTKSLK